MTNTSRRLKEDLIDFKTKQIRTDATLDELANILAARELTLDELLPFATAVRDTMIRKGEMMEQFHEGMGEETNFQAHLIDALIFAATPKH